jgi:hypothetical protein
LPEVHDCVQGRNIGDLLNADSISWGYFSGGFRPTSRSTDGTAVCGSRHVNIGGESVEDYHDTLEPFQYYKSTSNPHHLPPTSVAEIGHNGQANHQYDLTDFWSAVDAGQMPAVSYLKPAVFQDAHPAQSDPLDEQHFIVDALNRLPLLETVRGRCATLAAVLNHPQGLPQALRNGRAGGCLVCEPADQQLERTAVRRAVHPGGEEDREEPGR